MSFSAPAKHLSIKWALIEWWRLHRVWSRGLLQIWVKLQIWDILLIIEWSDETISVNIHWFTSLNIIELFKLAELWRKVLHTPYKVKPKMCKVLHFKVLLMKFLDHPVNLFSLCRILLVTWRKITKYWSWSCIVFITASHSLIFRHLERLPKLWPLIFRSLFFLVCRALFLLSKSLFLVDLKFRNIRSLIALKMQ